MIIFLSIIESIRYDVQFIHNDLANCEVGVMDLQSRGLRFHYNSNFISETNGQERRINITIIHSLYTHTWLWGLPLPSCTEIAIIFFLFLSLQAHSNIQTHIVV